MAERRFVDLAVVEAHNTGEQYVVELPVASARVGDIVEFEGDTLLNLGEIASVVTLERGGDIWEFINGIDGITPVVRYWMLGRGSVHGAS